jgi:hypothetical protein
VIVAQGDTILMLPADRAYVQMVAERRASKIAEAQRQSATAMTTLQAALKGAGVPQDAIRTTSYTVQPLYDRDGSLREYVARNVIEVRVDDLGRLADVIDASGVSGAASVSSLRFDLKNRGAAELDALRRAVKDANDRAKAMADGAGRALGDIVRLEEQRSSTASPVFRTGADAAGGRGGGGGGGVSTPIEPGEIQVRAHVALTIAIK